MNRRAFVLSFLGLPGALRAPAPKPAKPFPPQVLLRPEIPVFPPGVLMEEALIKNAIFAQKLYLNSVYGKAGTGEPLEKLERESGYYETP